MKVEVNQQSSDEWMESRTEHDWFRAPDSMQDKCIACGQPIRVNNIITEFDLFNFIHERCANARVNGYVA